MKLHIPAGQATPAPPVGPALAQHGVNIGDFAQKFNDATADKQGYKIPVDITVYEDGDYTFQLHEPPAAQLLKKAAGIDKGSAQANKKKSGTITQAQIREVAQQKMSDLNTDDVEQAVKIIQGTAKSMGLEVK